MTKISDMIGKTFTKVEVDRDKDRLFFVGKSGPSYTFLHHGDCCESVTIKDISGELDWLVGSPLVMAEEVSSSGQGGDSGDSFTWTFYKFATAKGYVTISWLGSSNGYYNEGVDLVGHLALLAVTEER